jgi:hypothetical protein
MTSTNTGLSPFTCSLPNVFLPKRDRIPESNGNKVALELLAALLTDIDASLMAADSAMLAALKSELALRTV